MPLKDRYQLRIEAFLFKQHTVLTDSQAIAQIVTNLCKKIMFSFTVTGNEIMIGILFTHRRS